MEAIQGFVAMTSGLSFGWSSSVWVAKAVRAGRGCSLQPNGSGLLGLSHGAVKNPGTRITDHSDPSQHWSMLLCVNITVVK